MQTMSTPREAALAAIITEALAVVERAEAAKARIDAAVAAAVEAETGYSPDDAMKADARIIIAASAEMLSLHGRADALLDSDAVADLDDLDMELWGQRVSRAMADMAWKAAEYGDRSWVEIAEHEDD